MIETLKALLLLGGAMLMLLAAVGVVRLPDMLTRMHATTKSASLGVNLIMLAVALHFFRDAGVVARAFAVIVFILTTAPVAAHAMGRAGYLNGTQLWSGTIKDELRPNYDAPTRSLKSSEEHRSDADTRPETQPRAGSDDGNDADRGA